MGFWLSTEVLNCYYMPLYLHSNIVDVIMKMAEQTANWIFFKSDLTKSRYNKIQPSILRDRDDSSMFTLKFSLQESVGSREPLPDFLRLSGVNNRRLPLFAGCAGLTVVNCTVITVRCPCNCERLPEAIQLFSSLHIHGVFGKNTAIGEVAANRPKRYDV